MTYTKEKIEKYLETLRVHPRKDQARAAQAI